MAEKISEKEYSVYRVVRLEDDPVPVRLENGPGLSRGILIVSEPDPDPQVLKDVALKYDARIIKINKDPGKSMWCEVSVNGRGFNSIARLEQTIDEVETMLNGPHGTPYHQALYPALD